MRSSVIARLSFSMPLVFVMQLGCSSDEGNTNTGADAGTNADTGSTSNSDSGGSTSDSGQGTTDAGPGDTGAPGTKEFGEACAGDSECKSNACFMGGQGNYCSIKCTPATAATDCPSPPTSGECNNKGYCKK